MNRTLTVAAVASLVLVYDATGELFLWSPSLIICVLYLIVSRDGREVLLDRVNLAVLGLMALAVAINPSTDSKEIFRFIYVLGGVAFARRMREGCHEQLLFVLLFCLLTTELGLRIAHGDFSEVAIYSMKATGGVFADSNFTAVFVFAIIASMIERRDLWRYLPAMMLLLLLTLSRTCWLMAGFYILARKFPKLGAVGIVVGLVFPVFLSGVLETSEADGSLLSKWYIYQTFIDVLRNRPATLLLGVGRSAATELAEEITGTTYSGHTLVGQTLQYGIVVMCGFYYVLCRYTREFVPRPYAFVATLLFGGVIGLAPSSYIGLLFVAATAVYHCHKTAMGEQAVVPT